MKIAAIDIGTNSIHMVIAEIGQRETIKVLIDEKEMVKLGVGVFATNRLSAEAFERGVEVIRRYVQLADQYGVDEIIAAATSATREAKNGGEFLGRVAEETGVTPQVISGKEEARLIFLAVRRAIAFGSERILVLDIGGGSTEATVGDQEDIFFKKSIKLGVLRLLDMVGGKDLLDKSEVQHLDEQITLAARDIMKSAVKAGFDKVIGTSGTIRALGEAAHLAENGASLSTVNAETVSLKGLKKITKKLLELPAEERTGIPGISANRVDAIHLGALLLVRLLELAKAKEITLCDASLREGLILGYLENKGEKLERANLSGDLRERSVLGLAVKYKTDIEQKRHVSFLARRLFDQMQDQHQLGDSERELLDFAGYIYEVGHFIGFPSYHKHSRYIIAHSRLRGFTNEEIILLGQIVRYHRKSGPRKSHKKYKKLPKAKRMLVQVLAGILRIAIGLDKTRNQWVEDLEVSLKDTVLSIHVKGEENPSLEIWEAMRNRFVLEKALNKDIVISAKYSPVPA